jgi:adenylate cyclase
LKELGRLQIRDELIRVQLTVVFWDISDFSAMCNDLYGFEDSIDFFLIRYFKKAIEIIHQHHGVLDKFMGDGILAYFGYNTINGDPFNAVNAALEFKKQFPALREQLDQYCKDTNGKKVRRIHLKCGIENGPAYVRYFNTPTRNSVILLGSTLNFASRLEGLAKKNEIIVSEELKDMIKPNYRFKKIPVKEREKRKIKSYEGVEFIYTIEGKKEGFR